MTRTNLSPYGGAVAPRPHEFRPYRVTLYALFLAFTVGWLGLMIRSVYLDLYATAPVLISKLSWPAGLMMVLRRTSLRLMIDTERRGRSFR